MMNKVISVKSRIYSFLIFLFLFFAFSPQKSSAQVSVNFQVFYDNLSPYGYWVENPQYGYVWVPNVGPGFSPYSSAGHWVFTDYGWTWISDYPWGWAPFHYGRWFNDPFYGPMWVPGNEWGPGWVSWRRCEGYYGWAPIEPGININVAYGNGYRVPEDRWVFVHDRDFGRRDLGGYYLKPSERTTIINNTTVINNVRTEKSGNVTYNAGPDRSEVQNRTGRTVAPLTIKESSKPGQAMSNSQLQMYRPRIEKSSGSQNTAPEKISNLKDIKPPAQRIPVQKNQAPAQSGQKKMQSPVQNQNSVQPKTNNPAAMPVQHNHIDRPVQNSGNSKSMNNQSDENKNMSQPSQRPSGRQQNYSGPSNQNEQMQPAEQPVRQHKSKPQGQTPNQHRVQESPRQSMQQPQEAPKHESEKPQPSREEDRNRPKE